MLNLRIFLMMLVAVLGLALLAAVLAPRIGLADGAGPGAPAAERIGTITGLRIARRRHRRSVLRPVGPATVLLAECPALPCLLEMDIGGRPGYLIVDYPNPRG